MPAQPRNVKQRCCLLRLVLLLFQAFGQFDAEGDGVVDVENMLMALKNSNGANLQGELSHVIRQLQACSLTPGKAIGKTLLKWAR